jgi:hypothetical protein
VEHTSAIRSARSSGGSSAAGVSQYRIRCGLRSASFEQPPGVPRRDRLDNAPPNNFVRQFTVTPLTDRSATVGRPFACQSDDLANLRGGELRRRARFRRIRQAFGRTHFFQRYLGELQPTPSPVTWGFVIDTQLARYLQIVPPVASQQHNARAQRQLLAGRVRAHQALQLCAFPFTQHHLGRSRRGHPSIPVKSRCLILPRLWHKSRLHSADVY